MSIQWKEKNICGAVLVNAKTALTAAHCCQLMESLVKQNEHWYDEILSKVTSRFSPLSLVAGEQTLSKEDGDEQVRHLFQNRITQTLYGTYLISVGVVSNWNLFKISSI